MAVLDSSLALFGAAGCFSLAWGAARAAGFSAGRKAPTGAIPRIPIGRVSGDQAVELSGKAVCKDPVIEPTTGTPCVWYRARLRRVKIAPGSDPDAEPPQTVTEVEEVDAGAATFRLRDDSGGVLVMTADATVEGRRLGKRPRRKPADPMVLEETLEVDGVKVGGRLLVRGYALPKGGGLVIGRDPKNRVPFTVRYEVLAEAGDRPAASASTLWALAAASLAMVGLVLLAMGMRGG